MSILTVTVTRAARRRTYPKHEKHKGSEPKEHPDAIRHHCGPGLGSAECLCGGNGPTVTSDSHMV